MSVPLGPIDLARRAAELKELLTDKAATWPSTTLDALRHRVEEVETAALELAARSPR